MANETDHLINRQTRIAVLTIVLVAAFIVALLLITMRSPTPAGCPWGTPPEPDYRCAILADNLENDNERHRSRGHPRP